jgi:integrase/recombinase XerD
MATLKIMLDPRTPTKADGTRSIVLRVTDRSKRNYLPLGMSVDPKNWNAAESKLKKAHDPIRFKEYNHNLNTFIADGELILSDFAAKKIPFSFAHFKTEFLIPKDPPGVFEFFDKTIANLKEKNKVGNAQVYQHAKNAISKYCTREEIDFHEVSRSFLEGFESYLIKEGCTGNTIHHYMRTFRALFYRAVETGYAKPEINPFYNNYTRQGYKFSHLLKATSKRALSAEDLKKLIKYKPSPMSKEEDAMLIFLFSYYAWGMNVTDIAKLRWDKNIQGNYIVYARTKTRFTKSFRIPIIEPLKEILAVCKEYSPKGYVFPILSDSIKDLSKQYTRIKTVTRDTNKILKDIGTSLKIETPITTYVARHSFASVLKRQGTAASIIKEMMGHTKEETTEIYLKNFENETLANASELLKM